MGEPVVIAGGGPAGLAAAAELGRRGVPSVVLERGEDVGTAWANRYPQPCLNTPRLTSSLVATGSRAATAAG